jgi:hypothetical protein
MPARTTRQEARERLLKMAQAVVDRLIPADEKSPLRGNVFADFENQTYAAGNDLLTAMMEERARLHGSAEATTAGLCPFCGSDRTYLEKEHVPRERQSPSGPVVLEEQNARCRACEGSFSPSSQRLGLAYRSRVNAKSGSTRGTRGRCTK